jgi:glucose/arabinose dehydrogenase
LRYNLDVSIPGDNPLTQIPDVSADDTAPAQYVRTPVFVVGVHQPSGIAVNPATGDLYIADHAPRTDVIAHLLGGDNYGWPLVSGRFTDAHHHAPLWSSGSAPLALTAATFYTGSVFPQFRGNLLLTNTRDGRLRRAIFSGADRIASVQIIPAAGDLARLDVQESPDGTLYFSSLDAVYRLRVRAAGKSTKQ